MPCDVDIDSYSEDERVALFALYYACNGSILAHIPEGAVTRGYKSSDRGDITKALKKRLRKDGLCKIQPTGRNTTYSITVDGIECFNKLLNKTDRK